MKFSNNTSRQKLLGWAFSWLIGAIFFAPQPLIAQQQTDLSPQRDEQITVNTDLITFNVSVTDDFGRAVSGLNKNAFTVFDNKQLQNISFFSDADLPASISVVFDTSSSMSGEKINQAKEALAQFIQTSKEEDEFFLVDFNSRPKLLLDRTHDSNALLNKFRYVEPTGDTALYDAISLGLERVLRGSRSKKIVLIISDGEDNNSRLTYKELKNQLKETDAVIYAVGFGGNFFRKGSLSGRETLKELASTSGGQAFFPDNQEETDEAFEQIALEIRHLYSIGYYPNEFTADGKKHRLKIKLNVPDDSRRLSVRTRAEYYAGTKLQNLNQQNSKKSEF